MMFRSTKGASKQRRDLINFEITQLRDMLPLPETARQRLSQLQIMSMACCYIRKSNYFSKLFANTSGTIDNPFEFFQAMSGFLLISTKEGKLLYISENVTEFLGHSMVDMMTQGDSIYDIIDKRDHVTVQTQLLQGSNNYGNTNGAAAVAVGQCEELTFFCRMNVSRSLRRQGGFGDHKVMHVRGHYMQPSIRDHYGNQPVFMGCVTPLVTPDVKETIIQNNTMIFQTVHSLDMKFLELSKNGEHHFGYSEEELITNSWYNYIHPEDIHEAKEKHSQLIKASHEMGCMLTIRILSKHQGFIWVNIVMHIRQPFISDNGDPAIVCINHVIDPAEANHFKLQSQLYSSHIARSPEFLSNPPSSSPPHTITQIPMEGDQYQMQGYGSDMQSPGYYQAQFTTAPIHSNIPGQHGTVSEPMPLNRVSMSSLSDSGNSSDSVGTTVLSPTDSKTITHLELINRLKRKLPQQCKPVKKPKTVVTENADSSSDSIDNNMSYFGSAVISQSYFMDSLVNSDGQQMLLQMNSDRPVYAQLKKSPVDLAINDPHLLLKQSIIPAQPLSPMGPLTPESVTSSEDNHHQTKFDSTSLLTIDVKNEVCLPPSLLTPDASPLNSPLETSYSQEELSEQCVPSIIDEIANAIRKQERETQKFHLDKPYPEKAKIKMVPQNKLPELDPFTIDSYFGAMGDIVQALECYAPIKEELTQPSSFTSHTYPHSSAVSPVSLPQVSQPANAQIPISVEKQPKDTESEAMFQMGEQDLANIVASVAGSIMDMVQRSTSTETGLTADFMLIPNNSIPDMDNEIFAEVPEIKQEVEDEEEQEERGVSPLHGELLHELHQLNQLAANSTPSYGDKTDLVDAFFNQNL